MSNNIPKNKIFNNIAFAAEEKIKTRKTLVGVIVSKTDKTIIVRVEIKVTHGKYSKILRRYRKYAAHNPKNIYEIGQKVTIVASRPISKTKFFEVKEQL